MYIIIRSSWRKKKGFRREKAFATKELNIFAGINTFTSAIKRNISWLQTFANLPKKFAKLRNFVAQKFLTLKYVKLMLPRCFSEM